MQLYVFCLYIVVIYLFSPSLLPTGAHSPEQRGLVEVSVVYPVSLANVSWSFPLQSLKWLGYVRFSWFQVMNGGHCPYGHFGGLLEA
jgi:hypothetical protein